MIDPNLSPDHFFRRCLQSCSTPPGGQNSHCILSKWISDLLRKCTAAMTA